MEGIRLFPGGMKHTYKKYSSQELSITQCPIANLRQRFTNLTVLKINPSVFVFNGGQTGFVAKFSTSARHHGEIGWPNTTESKSVVGVAFAFGLPAYDQLKSNPDVQCFDRKSQKLIPNIETFLKDNGGLFKEASNSGEVELIPLQSIVYAVTPCTA